MLFMIAPSVADIVLASVIGFGLLVMAFDLKSKKNQKAA